MIKDRLGTLKRHAYTLRIDSKPQEVTRFERRGVKVINIPKGNNKTYGQILEEVFEELRDYWTNEYPNIVTITEEDPLIELSIATDSSKTSRLCYFSVPAETLSLYKKYIFPIAESYGLAPITADDVLTSGNNIAAKITALIERSSVVVIDISHQITLFELGIVKSIQAKKKKISTVLIVEEGASIPNEFSNENFIMRPSSIFENIEGFISELEQRFQTLSLELQSGFESEPTRLLAKKEFRAAVVSSVTLLETQLRRKIENNIETNKDLRLRPYPMRKLLEISLQKGLFDQKFYPGLLEAVSIRNNLVHGQGEIDSKTAKLIVQNINDALKGLKDKL